MIVLRSGFAVAALVLAGCASTPSSAPAPEAGFHQNSFTDPSRGIHATLPTGWVFVAPDRFSKIQSSGLQTIEESNPQLALNAAEAAMRTQFLFIMTNASAPGTGQESISLVAEALDPSLLGMTTETYALALRNSLKSVGYRVYREQPKSVGISGSEFQALHAMVAMGSGTHYQSYYVRLEGREILSFIASHDRIEREGDLLEIIQSIDLE